VTFKFEDNDASKLGNIYGVVLCAIMQKVRRSIRIETEALVQTVPSEIKVAKTNNKVVLNQEHS
jgi:hypothetical protein